MRYIPNKADDDKDSVSNLGKEYNLNPIIENNMLVNTTMGQLNTIYNQIGQQIKANEYCENNMYDTDTCHISYSVKVDSGVFIHLCGDNSIRYTERKVSQTQRNNLKGGLSHTRKINDMYIEICDAIFFVSGYIYEREDRPGKEYYNVLSFTDVNKPKGNHKSKM